MSMGSRPHLLGAYAASLSFLVLLLIHTCSARDIRKYCSPSSCGNIHTISYPFRLKSDPQSCGDKNHELVCENNRTTLYINTMKYYVQAIDYNTFSFRLLYPDVQKDNCSSIPRHPLAYNDIDQFDFQSDMLHSRLSQLTFTTCASPVNSPLYVSTSSCNNSSLDNSSTIIVSSPSQLKAYTYVLIDASFSDLKDSCHIDLVVMASLRQEDFTNNISYKIIHDRLASGFELSWFGFCCYTITNQNACGIHLPSFHTFCSYLTAVHFREALRRLTNGLLRILGKWMLNDEPGGWIHYKRWIDKWRRKVQFEIWIYSPGCIIFVVFFLVLLATNVLFRAILFFCGVPCLIIFLIYKWRRRHLSMFDAIEEFLRDHNLMPIRYSYSDIKKITKGFKDKLGEGGYGSVYKGKLRSGRFIAIKLLGKSKSNGQEFINEVATIGRIHHVNVVKLVGFCAEGSRRALVYEFMPNGSLDKFIFFKEGSISMDDEKIYEIALGVARGIEYLHRGCDMQILHFDIKPHNILLDENFIPKISDFGLAKLYPTDDSIVPLTAARGTLGYMAPELFYKNLGGVSYKADVYSFGMLLMEMVGRRKNLKAVADHSSQIYFPSWIYDQLIEGKLDINELGDRVMEQEKKTRKKMIITALWCIQLKPNDRPSMHAIIKMLTQDVECLQIPPKPFLTSQQMSEEDDMAGIANPTIPLDDYIDSSYKFGR